MNSNAGAPQAGRRPILRQSLIRFAVAILLLTLLIAATARPPRLLILGDSLTEGYGVEPEQAYPALLDSLMQARFPGAKVIGGGVSGATSAGAIRRLEWYARSRPEWVMLALGSNDGLRGIPIEETRKNLDSTIRFCQKRGWKVILAGLKVPPNYGAEYASAFTGIFDSLASQYGLPYFPFLLDGVAGNPKMNQGDGIHPNVPGHALMAKQLFQFLIPLPGFFAAPAKSETKNP